MAYVVTRRNGRFEIRESHQTSKGPRARTLASFRVLDEAVLRAATRRATRPFARQSVLDSAERAGAPFELDLATESKRGQREAAFVAASRRMAAIASAPGAEQHLKADPGEALIQLLGFADMVAASQRRPPREPLGFPPISRLAGVDGQVDYDALPLKQHR